MALDDRYPLAFRLYPYERASDQDADAPVRHPVVVMGGGPIGVATALDLGLQGIPVVVLDDHEGIGQGPARSVLPSAALKSPTAMAPLMRCWTKVLSGTWARCFGMTARCSNSTSCPKRATSSRPLSTCNSPISNNSWCSGSGRRRPKVRPSRSGARTA